jgi:hypothetical protein
MSASRDRLLVQVLGGLVLVLGCSRLTAVNWDLIQPDDEGEGGAGATDSGGTAGVPSGGNPIGGSVNEGGAPSGGEGGEGGEAGSEDGGSGGNAGFGGFGGFAGFGGFGGSTAGGTGGDGGGGMAGTAGTGIGGGLSTDPDPCTGTPSTVVAEDLVLFDGGQGKPNTARGGRAGLDAACATALAKLSLPQTQAHAFITVSSTDSINFWTTGIYLDISKTARVVGPTGIQLAPDFATLIGGPLQQSLACAGVTSASDRTWLTGAWTCSSTPPIACFQPSDGNDNCNGWTFAEYSPLIQARYGYTIYKDPRWAQGDSVAKPAFAKVACNAATDNVLCMAYTPVVAP